MAEKNVITLFCLFLKKRNHNHIIVSEKVNNKFLMFLNSYLLFKYPRCHTYAFHTCIRIICPRKYFVFYTLVLGKHVAVLHLEMYTKSYMNILTMCVLSHFSHV